jgi:hypothetical protein
VGSLLAWGTLVWGLSAGGQPCRWLVQPPPRGVLLSDVFALASNDVWAVGPNSTDHRETVVRWDGSRWNPIPTPPRPAPTNWLTSVGGVGPDDLWAAGIAYPGPTDRRSYPVMEHWDGSSWTDAMLLDLHSSQGGLGSVTAISPDDVWAFGWYGERNLQHPLAEHWNGHRWAVSALPDTGTGLDALWSASAASATDVWAVGRDLDSVPAVSRGSSTPT